MRARPGEGRRPVTLPRALARYTRGAVNTVTLRLAGHLAFADLEHADRKSGTVTTPRCARSGPGHRDRRLELRAPAGLVPEHQRGWHLPDASRRRAAHPRRAGARPRSPGRHGSALAVQVRAQARGAHGRLRPAAHLADIAHPGHTALAPAPDREQQQPAPGE